MSLLKLVYMKFTLLMGTMIWLGLEIVCFRFALIPVILLWGLFNKACCKPSKTPLTEQPVLTHTLFHRNTQIFGFD